MHATHYAVDPWRTPGCTNLCHVRKVIEVGTRETILLEVHDYEGHERYGQLTPIDRAQGTQRIGCLEIDHSGSQCYVHGTVANLTFNEWRILQSLARWAGEIVTHSTLLRMVWGNGYEDDSHLLRVNMARLRGNLGEGGQLIHTRLGIGYGLFDYPDPNTLYKRAVGKPRKPTQAAVYVPGARQVQVLRYLRTRHGKRVTVSTLVQAIYGRESADDRKNMRYVLYALQTAGVRLTVEPNAFGRECVTLTGPLPDGIRDYLAAKGR